MNDLLDLIAQNQRLAVQVDSQNSMHNFQIEVLQNHNPHMIRIKPEDQQRDLFADCVIFADAGFVHELIWRCPIVFKFLQSGIHLIGLSISCWKMSAASSTDVSSRCLPTTSTTKAVARLGRVSANSWRRPNRQWRRPCAFRTILVYTPLAISTAAPDCSGKHTMRSATMRRQKQRLEILSILVSISTAVRIRAM